MKSYSRFYLSNFDLTDIKISNVIVLHLYLLISKNMLISTSDFFFALNDLLNLAIIGVFLVIYAYLFITSKMLKQVRWAIYIILIISAVFILVTFISFPERFTLNVFPYNYVRRNIRSYIAYCLPLFVAIGSLRSVECLLQKLYDFTIFPYIFATISFVFSLQPHDEGNYMSYGNAVMFLAIVLLFKSNHTKYLFNLVQFFTCCIYILVSGSRGSLISILVAFIVYLLINKAIHRRVLLIVLTISFGTYFLLNYEDVIVQLFVILRNIGIESRTIRLATIGEFFDDSGRAMYHQRLLYKLNDQPIIGLGAFGGEATVGLAHSIYLDIFANFGYVFGVLFLIYILGRILQALFTRWGTAYTEMILLLSVVVFPLGFVDMSFWDTKELWMLMALFVHNINFVSKRQFNYIPLINKFER